MSDAENTIATLRSRGYEVTAVGSVMMALAVVAVGLRFLAKSGNEIRWSWDDILIGFALLVYIVDESLILAAVAKGQQATNDASPEWVAFSKYLTIYSLLYWTIIAFTTFSILFLYRRLFSAHKFFRTSSIVLGVLTGMWWISGTVANVLAYQPLRAYWDITVPGHYVINYNDFWISNMIIELFFEAAVIFLPVFEILKLKLDIRKKMFMAAMFGMGGLVLITGALRIHYAWKSSDMIPGTIWLSIHSSIAIISACLPTYRPLLAKIPGVMPMTRHGTSTMDGTWSRTKRPSNASATLKNSQSFDETLLHKPQSLGELQLDELDMGIAPRKLSHAHPTVPIIMEEATQSEETLQYASTPPTTHKYGL